MDLKAFKLLFSQVGRAALGAAEQLQPREVDYLRHFQNLTKEYPARIAQAALETAILRHEAQQKFPQAGKMYFTREALEQASPDLVSRHRSERYRDFKILFDLGCSIGSDTVNLARMVRTVAMDIDPLRLAMAQANAEALGMPAEIDFVLADLNAPLPLGNAKSCALFFDPARRSEGVRVRSVMQYFPPLSVIADWTRRYPDLGVKLSPGVDKSEIVAYDAELEFVSLGGELKEGLLWFGGLKKTKRTATILPGAYSLTGEEGAKTLPLGEPRKYLYEPDAAVLRAGLVADLGEQLGAYQLDPDIAYLTAQNEVPNPFSRVWEVEDWFAFSVKRLRAYLRERKVGAITVKKRGSPLKPEELISMLRLKGDQQRVVFLTHLDGKPITIVCYPTALKK